MNKKAHKNGDGKARIEFIPPLALIRNGGRGGHDASGNWSSRGSWGAVVVMVVPVFMEAAVTEQYL